MLSNDFLSSKGLPHSGIARLIAESFAKRTRPVLTLVVQDQVELKIIFESYLVTELFILFCR